MNVTTFSPHALGAALLDHSKYGFSNKKVEDYKLPQINDTGDYITFRAGLDRVLRAADLQDFFKNVEEKSDFYEWAVDHAPGAVPKAMPLDSHAEGEQAPRSPLTALATVLRPAAGPSVLGAPRSDSIAGKRSGRAPSSAATCPA